MSWQDDIKNIPFEIVTGDGEKWSPLLVPKYKKDIAYNGTEYNFIERAGSLYARRLPRGRSYQLEFVFKGENNVKVANSFEKSARDERSWKVTHPFFGKLTVQPMSMSLDSSGFDCTVIQCQVIETLVANQPQEKPNNKDIISEKIDEVNSAALVALSPIKSGIPVKHTQYALKVTNNIATRVEEVSKLESEYKSYREYLSGAINELNNATGLTDGYLTYLQKLITLPATVASDIGTRFRLLNNSLESLVENFSGVATVSYFEKLFYNLTGSLVVTASCEALCTQNDGDFQSKSEVNLYIDRLKSLYETYLENLYNLEDNEFNPDHDMMFSLHLLVSETVSLLYQVLFSSSQERIYYPPRDTNLILLAHRLYGEASEENLSTLKETNRIGISEILNIKKDRAIKYYV